VRETLHARFSELAARQPDRIAVRGADVVLTYRELDARSDRLAAAISAAPDGPVAIRMRRGGLAPLAVLAVAKAGRAYVPVDPAYPQSRQQHILSDSGATLLVCDDGTADEPSVPQTVEHIALVRLPGHGRPSLPERAAYVIYTSGSTGRPKGCVVTHDNVTALIDAAAGLFGFGLDDVWTLFHSLSFDFSVWELWAPLLSGGSVVVVPPDATTDPRALLELLRRHHVTVLNQVPSVFGHLVNEAALTGARLPDLRRVIFGGEAIVPTDLLRWLDLDVAPQAELINMYGITETTVHVTYCRLSRELIAASTPGRTPIGRALPHLTVSLRDETGAPAAQGQAGEIWVSGDGVCAGYLGLPELTTQRFPHEQGLRWYRSGDWGVQAPDGELFYAGRRDEQVKLGGFRIELGEVESVLRKLPGVAAAACTVQRTAAGVDQLVAYVVLDDATPLPAATIRQQLGATLPAHLVPHRLHRLERLPVTGNGKLDRAALATATHIAEPASAAGRAPRSPREEVLRELFAEVLGLPSVSIDDDFFEAGGHSLMAIRLVNRVRTVLGADVTLADLFANRTVAMLHDRLAGASQRPPLRRWQRPQRLPLSYAQERLWFLQQVHGENPAYHIPYAVRLTGDLDVAALAAALGDVVRRHEALRTLLVEEDGTPYQRILPPAEAVPPLPVQHVPPGEREQLDTVLQAIAYAPFRLDADLPVRAAVVGLGPREHLFVLVLHHSAGDGWSLGPLSRDLSVAYRARRAGVQPQWEQLPVQYADYALWQRSWLDGPDGAAAAQLQYWTAALDGLPDELELPTDHPRPTHPSFRGGAVDVDVDADVHRRLTALARVGGATFHMVLQAAIAALLTRMGAGTDIPIGTPIAGRTDDAVESLVGFFVNTLVLRTDTSGDPSFAELLRRVRDRDIAAYAHQDLPFERLVEALNPPRSAARHPLFQVMLATQSTVLTDFDLGDLAAEVTPIYHDTAKFDLSFKLDELRGPDGEPLGVAGGVEYNGDLFDRRTVETLVRCLGRLLAEVAERPGVRLSAIDLQDPAERSRVASWNATDAPLPSDWTVATMIERQVDETPDAVAVVQRGSRWTYRQLDAEANRIAHALIGLGARQGVRVAVHLPRGPQLVAALLGAWKAGCAYVPLDPDYPSNRLEFMCADSGVTIVLTNDALAGRLQLDERVASVRVDSDEQVTRARTNRPDDAGRHRSGADLAYVIYTSGSTGTPKSVMINHAGVVNRLRDMVDRFRLTAADVSLQLISAGFEPPVREIFAPLSCGGSVALLPPEGPRDPAVVVDAIREHRPTVMLCIVPSLLEAVIGTGAPAADFASLRMVATGGEVLRPAEAAELLNVWGCEVVNQYGPTEATMMSCLHRLRPEDLAGPLPIGHALANTRVHLLDRYLREVPVGIAGEVYLAGIGLARGYLGRAGLTATSFVANPFGRPGERMYRTGDICRRRSDGALEFVGRADGQVKVRGFRIETGEVEAALREQPEVGQAAVIVREDRPGDRRLVAYVTPANGHAPEPAQLRQALAVHLPEHMVPGGIVVLDAMPLRGNGKLNRDLLPVPDSSGTGRDGTGRPPRTPFEELLCELFAEVLGLPEPVRTDDDFFQLGGHSLLAARLIGRVRTLLGVQLAMRSFFEAPTVAGLARRAGVDRTTAALEVLLPLRRSGDGTPLFCVHPGGGLSWCYAGLTRHLGPDVPLFGIQARGLLQPDDMPATVTAMAGEYVRAIEAVWPAGPYRLLGWSFGGIVAHEVARLLQQAGSQVDLIAMMDCYPGVANFYRVDEHDLFMSLVDPARAAGIPRKGSREISEAVAILQTEGGALAGLDETQLEALLRTMAHNRVLVAPFTPGHVDSDVLFFQATQGRTPGAPEPDVWRAHTSGTVDVHRIDARHMDLADPEPLARIGQILAGRLARLDTARAAERHMA
jgi:nonribosomal peptide synthetase DhbF